MKKKFFNEYWFAGSSAVVALLPFLARLFFSGISIDTEQMINTPQRILTSWLYHERPGLVVSKYLFGQTTFHYEIAIIGAVFCLVLACCVFVWITKHPTGKSISMSEESRNRHWFLLFPFLFLTHPIIAEQMHFLLQSMEIAWAIVLCLVAVSLTSISLWQLVIMDEQAPERKRRERKKSVIMLLAAMIAMVWSFSSYQALAALYIAATAGIFILQYDQSQASEKFSGKMWWQLALLQVLMFGIGFLLSRLAAKIGLYISTGSFESTAYVSSMMRWGNQPVRQCLKELYQYGMKILSGQGTFYTLAYVTVLIGTLIAVLCRPKGHRHVCGYAAYLIAGVILYISPFLLALYTGGADQIRAQLALPFVLAFSWCYFISLLKDSEITEKLFVRKISWIAITIAGLFACLQYVQTIRLTYTAHQTYQQECALTTELIADIEAAGAPQNAAIQFIGTWTPQMSKGMIRGETIGYSFYEWDKDKAYGPTERIVGLWNTLGYDYTCVDMEDASAGHEIATAMPCWPENGSVVWTGKVVVVKLSE